MVEVEKVVLVGCGIPFDVGELSVVTHIVVSEAAVKQETVWRGLLGVSNCAA